MFRITDAMNTYNYAINVIYTKQYKLYTLKDDEDYILYLEKKDFIIAGNDPLSLLAISYINDNKRQLLEEQYDLLVNQFEAVAINIILQMKYNINVTSVYSSNGYDWVGKKKDEIYYAGSVLKLLGLILLVECYGRNWQSANIPLHLNDIPEF